MLSLSRQIVFLIPAVMILPRIAGIDGILWGGPAADALAFVLALIVMGTEIKKLKPETRKAQRPDPGHPRRFISATLKRTAGGFAPTDGRESTRRHFAPRVCRSAAFLVIDALKIASMELASVALNCSSVCWAVSPLRQRAREAGNQAAVPGQLFVRLALRIPADRATTRTTRGFAIRSK